MQYCANVMRDVIKCVVLLIFYTAARVRSVRDKLNHGSTLNNRITRPGIKL